jgi:hypothetical protein
MGRHISIKIQREVEWKFRLHCGFPGCKKPARDLHHTKRFSIVKRHSADEIAPLCKIHHELAHTGLIGNEDGALSTWYLKEESENIGPVAEVDEVVRRKRLRNRLP